MVVPSHQERVVEAHIGEYYLCHDDPLELYACSLLPLLPPQCVPNANEQLLRRGIDKTAIESMKANIRSE